MAGSPLEALQENLGYRFQNVGLLQRALTHRSFENEHRDLGVENNERFEFLGDSVLGFVVSALLHERFPDANEGELTRRRAELVSEKGLKELAAAFELGKYLQLGRGEERTGGRDKSRLLASALEACIAAILLDSNISTVFDVVTRWMKPRICSQEDPKDFKSAAQEYYQKTHGVTPRYEVLKTVGPEHDKQFWVAIKAGHQTLAEGRGRTKSEAEQQAAYVAIEHTKKT